MTKIEIENKIAWHYKQIRALIALRTANNPFINGQVQAHLKEVNQLNMKKMQTKDKGDYKYIETNIYKTGTRYRVRVQDFSGYQTTLKEARKMRTRFRKMASAEPVFG